MLSINTNLPSIIAQNSLKQSTLKLNTAIERMTTGYKINGAKDNAANYSIVTNMTTKIGAYQIAEDNCAMGLDLITTASESLDLINDKLVRLRALAEQSANGTYGEQSLKAINAEANALIDEIERSYKNTEYNGINLFPDSASGNEVDSQLQSFIMPINRLSESEALAQGYTIIKSVYDLQAMQHFDSNGSSKYILMNDIDLAGVAWTSISDFTGELNGNGYEIKHNTAAMFCGMHDAVVKNLGLTDVNISGNDRKGTGALDGWEFGNLLVENCYVSGKVTDYLYQGVGGFFGNLESSSTLRYCYSTADVTGGYCVGGLCGTSQGNIEYCFTSGNIGGAENIGGLVGRSYYVPGKISNSYSTCNVAGGSSVGYAVGPDLEDESKFTCSNIYYCNPEKAGAGYDAGVTTFINEEELANLINNGVLVKTLDEPEIQANYFNLQIGIDSRVSSQIQFDLSFEIANLASLRGIGQNNADYLNQIDTLINKVSAKQTEYGAAQNRLESALDEISTQYENLVSSRSTLRDADIAEVSSEYIRQQILQQASATLLSTANQTPALALQLL